MDIFSNYEKYTYIYSDIIKFYIHISLKIPLKHETRFHLTPPLRLKRVFHFQGTRFKVTYDGMMHYLEIPRCREYDAGQIRVVTKNPQGEAETSTSLTVLPKEDWRAKLKQAPKGRHIVLYCL